MLMNGTLTTRIKLNNMMPNYEDTLINKLTSNILSPIKGQKRVKWRRSYPDIFRVSTSEPRPNSMHAPVESPDKPLLIRLHDYKNALRDTVKAGAEDSPIPIWSLSELMGQLAHNKHSKKPARYQNRPSDLVEYESSSESVFLELDKGIVDATNDNETRIMKDESEITASILSSGVSEKNKAIANERTVGTLKGTRSKYAVSPKGSDNLSQIESDEEVPLKPFSIKFEMKEISEKRGTKKMSVKEEDTLTGNTTLMNQYDENVARKSKVSSGDMQFSVHLESTAPYSKISKQQPATLFSIELLQISNKKEVLRKYMNHCAEVIQKIYRGYVVRNKHAWPIYKRIYYRELRKGLIIGWKTRRILTCGKLCSAKEDVYEIIMPMEKEKHTDEVRHLRRKCVERLTELFHILYVTGKWVKTCTFQCRKAKQQAKMRAIKGDKCIKTKSKKRLIRPMVPYIIPQPYFIPVPIVKRRRSENEITNIPSISINKPEEPPSCKTQRTNCIIQEITDVSVVDNKAKEISRKSKQKEVRELRNKPITTFDDMPIPVRKSPKQLLNLVDTNSKMKEKPQGPIPFLKRKTKRMEPQKLNWQVVPRKIDCWRQGTTQTQQKLQVIAIHKNIE